MEFDSINFYRDESGATQVLIQLKVPRAGKFDASMIDRVLAVLDGGEPEKASGGEPQTAPEATQGRRSRRSTTEAPAEANPTQGRRSRRTSATASEKNTVDSGASTADPSPASSSEPAAQPARRRRQQPEAPAGITDADLSKAASQAAAVITPEVVTEILTEFGVGEVNQLKQDVRREFIDLLNAEIEKAP